LAAQCGQQCATSVLPRSISPDWHRPFSYSAQAWLMIKGADISPFLSRLLRLLACVMAFAAAALSAAETPLRFDLPAGKADRTLHQFAEITGREILYASEVVRGVTTAAVHGEFTPTEALERMLSNTELHAIPADAIAVVRRTVSIPAPQAAERVPSPENDKSPNNNHRIYQPLKNRTFFTLFFSWLVAGSALDAQTTPTPATAAQQTIQLSPFVVSTEKDKGYIAADTLNAGRLSTNLLMTPSDLTVLTRDFINDIGAFDMIEASGWLTSSQANEPGSGASSDVRDFGAGTTQRGMVTQRNTRNYFATSSTPEEYIVERMEGARGPNAILYGDGGPGGQVNYLTKRALSYNLNRVRLRTDSEGTAEVTADINRKFGDNLSVRYNGRIYRGRSWVERFFDNRTSSAISVSYRPWKNGELRFDGELNNINRANRTDNYLDQSSLWNGVGLNNAAAATPAGSGITRFTTTTPTWIYVDGLGLLDWRGFGRSAGTGLAMLPYGTKRDLASFPVLPRKGFSAQPNQMNVRNRQADAQLAFEQRFGSGLTVEVAFAYAYTYKTGATLRYSDAYTDVNVTMPGGAVNPNYGKLFSLATYGNALDGTTDSWMAGRAAANYPFRIGDITQNLSVIVQNRQQRANLKSVQRYRTDSVPLAQRSAGNLITIYRYWDNLPDDLPDSLNVPMVTVPTRDTLSQLKLGSVQVNTYGSYLADRLSFIAGCRRDLNDASTRDIALVDPVSGLAISTVKTHTRAYSNSYSSGVVYFPIKAFGGYLNYSEGFVSQNSSNPKIDGSSFTSFIVPSANKSAGVRLKMFNGRLVGSAGYYTSKETGRNMNIGVGDINNLLTRHGQPALITYSNTAVSDFSSIEGWGWEGEVTASFSNRFRMTANIAFPQTKQSNMANAYRAYIADHLVQWQGYANDLNNTTRVADATSLANVQNTLASFNEGRAQNGTYKCRANIFGNYTIPKGHVKGLSIGGGVQIYGKRLIGNKINLPYDYVYMDGYSLASASLSYPFTWNKTKINVQLNVLNLFDFADPIFAATAVKSGVLYPNTYTYQTPRTFRLTTALTF
jgi:outer membrane receptor for ferric coprogen and ferric-rhodotorulic acid